jgi:protein-S-isoprenylcysteine O-methyltransferase Ste14
MNELHFYYGLVSVWLAVAAAVFLSLFFITAPYGRYSRRGWGPTIDNASGWVLMELPSLILFTLFFLISERTDSSVAMVFCGMWLAHYIYRSLVFPSLIRTPGKRMPVLIVTSGIMFNVGNSYLNGRWLFTLGPDYGISWLKDPRFIFGFALFLTGFAIHFHSDRILRNLRAPGETGYNIPEGGLFQWISSPNYFGELLEWTGWALATWSLPGVTFLVWTAANLLPRARSNHRWYRNTFADYPKERKALIPAVW